MAPLGSNASFFGQSVFYGLYFGQQRGSVQTVELENGQCNPCEMDIWNAGRT